MRIALLDHGFAVGAVILGRVYRIPLPVTVELAAWRYWLRGGPGARILRTHWRGFMWARKING